MNHSDTRSFSLPRAGVTPISNPTKGNPALTPWEGELGGPAIAGETMGAKCGPARGNACDPFAAKLPEEAVKALKDLDAAGGHGEAHTESQRRAMADLLRQRLVNRTTYKNGLVIFEITDAGRAHVRGLSS